MSSLKPASKDIWAVGVGLRPDRLNFLKIGTPVVPAQQGERV